MGEELKVIVPEIEEKKLLMIGMPCYGCQMHIDATQTLMETMNNGVHFQWVSIGNESLISRARNKDRKSTRLNSSHSRASRMPSSA